MTISEPKERGVNICIVGCGNVGISAQTIIRAIEIAESDPVVIIIGRQTKENRGSVSLSDANRFFHGGVLETKQLIKVLREDFEYYDIDAELQAEKREGWLKPHKQLNPITYSSNGMIDRLINNRVREPGRA